MKALLLSEYSVLQLADLPVPEPGPGEVLVRVGACGICGSDVHGYDGSSGRRIPPLVMGHEAAGTIAAVGKGVGDFHEGDRVAMDSTIYCGSCDFCASGEVNLCDRRKVLGVSCGDYRQAGAFAEYVAVPARILCRLPANLPLTEAAMLEPLSVALHAVKLTPMTDGGSALVVGAGMIGLLITQALRAAGWSRIFVSDVDDSRLRLAKELGASQTLNASEPDFAARLAALSSAGVDVALEAVGTNQTVAVAIDSVRKGGAVTLVGNVTPDVNLPLQKVVSRQIRLQGSCACAGEYPKAVELLANGSIRVKPLISAISPLEEGPRWFERLHAREPNLMKVILTPGAAA
jgi:L-iditol 2-dehydrogenase